jgi:hypothetical protein
VWRDECDKKVSDIVGVMGDARSTSNSSSFCSFLVCGCCDCDNPSSMMMSLESSPRLVSSYS